MASSNVAAFKKELKSLLKKYDATIGFGCSDCSDTHGINDERIEVDFRLNRPRFETKTVRLSCGWSVDQSDI